MKIVSFFRQHFNRPIKQLKSVDVLLAGLGNPGEQYSGTRHNIGFRVIDSFVQLLSHQTEHTIPDATIIIGNYGSISVAALKPTTFMNLSGKAIDAAIRRWNIPIKSCFVVVDDFNIPLGTIRARRSGSAGGHNGLKSIIEFMGSDFARLRIGIGPITENTAVIDFVLGNFSTEEEALLSKLFPWTNSALRTFIDSGIESVMNTYNKQSCLEQFTVQGPTTIGGNT